MKKITINHKVEITNNVLGFVYHIIQYTELYTDKVENEFVEVRCFAAETGLQVFKQEFAYSLYPAAKKKMKEIILEILPI